MTTTTLLLTLAIVFGALSWIYSGVFLALIAGNRRFWKRHQKETTPTQHTYARSCVIIPCKGVESGLRENLTSFLRQDHPNYEVFFVIEHESDPAATLIYNLMEENRCVKTRLIVAGRAENCGQKTHNLRMATKQLSQEIEVLVFADSDAKPNKTWLRWLVNGIGNEGLGARTGYRWMIPAKNNFPTLIVCSISNAIAAMLGRGKHNLVWGGSWAIHRKVFDLVGVRESWYGALSDDLVASRALRNAGLRIEFEPQCVCTTKVRFSTKEMTNYLRRQLLISRQYSPKFWYAGMAIVASSQIGFWAAIVTGVWGISQGMLLGYFALTSAVLLYVMGVARSVLRSDIGRRAFPEWKKCKKARKFDMFGGPVIGAVTFGAMLSSCVGGEIIWRGIRYCIGRGGRVCIIGRDLPAGKWPIESPASASDHSEPTIKIARTEDTQSLSPIQEKQAESAVVSTIPMPTQSSGILWDVHAGNKSDSNLEKDGFAGNSVLRFPGHGAAENRDAA
ncbi:MAG: glycosyltransferase family 2 protein [Mariniblastus sp.]